MICHFCKIDVKEPCRSLPDADECRSLPAAKTERPDDLHLAEYRDDNDR